MSQLSEELHYLKEDLLNLIRLVKTQFTKSREAMLNLDKNLAKEVIANEKRVNAEEIKIDRDCEKILALYKPVAIDLRFVLATLKMNGDLERIGDNAESIANFILDAEEPFKEDVIKNYQLLEMYDTSMSMFDDSINAFVNEDTSLARKVFQKDDYLDESNHHATMLTMQYMKNSPDQEFKYLTLLSIVRKLERVGDQTTNLAEEIIFYIEAKVLKHQKNKDIDD